MSCSIESVKRKQRRMFATGVGVASIPIAVRVLAVVAIYYAVGCVSLVDMYFSFRIGMDLAMIDAGYL